MIYFYSIIGIIFVANLFFKFDNPTAKFYRTKLYILYAFAVAFLLMFSWKTYIFYSAQNSVSDKVTKNFDLEIVNNSVSKLDLKFYTVNQNTDAYQLYYLNKLKLSSPNRLLQKIELLPNLRLFHAFKIPSYTYLLIVDKNSGKGIKTYATDLKMRLYSSDFKTIETKFNVFYWNEIEFILISIICLLVIAFIIKRLPNKLLYKIILIIPLLLLFIISLFNLYLMTRILGNI